jgi:hypothetical protein
VCKSRRQNAAIVSVKDRNYGKTKRPHFTLNCFDENRFVLFLHCSIVIHYEFKALRPHI